MEFYYPNFINDMWRIFGLVYFGDKDRFVDQRHKTFRLDELRPFLEEKGIALSDTGREVVREKDNAADKHLSIKRHIDLADILSGLPECEAVATTGEKAAGVIAELTGTPPPKMGEMVTAPDGLEIWRMPSTSRAYPLAVEKKAEYYASLFRHLGIL